MESVSLKENVLRIIEILTSLIGGRRASASFPLGPVASLSHPSQLAFKGIDNTINPIHGDDSRKNINEIMLNFIPMLLLKHPNGNSIQANQVPKPLLNIRAAVIDFIRRAAKGNVIPSYLVLRFAFVVIGLIEETTLSWKQGVFWCRISAPKHRTGPITEQKSFR